MPTASSPAPTADAIVAEARTWIGTRVGHRGRRKGILVDCLGLGIGVGVATGALDDPHEAQAEWRNYGRLPNPARMKRFLAEHMIWVGEDPALAADGLVGWFSWGGGDQPMHVAIMSSLKGRRMMIHANPLVVPPHVTEHGFSGKWVAQCKGFWRYPHMAGG